MDPMGIADGIFLLKMYFPQGALEFEDVPPGKWTDAHGKGPFWNEFSSTQHNPNINFQGYVSFQGIISYWRSKSVIFIMEGSNQTTQDPCYSRCKMHPENSRAQQHAVNSVPPTRWAPTTCKQGYNPSYLVFSAIYRGPTNSIEKTMGALGAPLPERNEPISTSKAGCLAPTRSNKTGVWRDQAQNIPSWWLGFNPFGKICERQVGWFSSPIFRVKRKICETNT